MPLKNHRLTCLAINASAILLMTAAAPAQAQFMGVFQGISNVLTQATGKIGNKVMGGETTKDLQVERDNYFAQLEVQTAGMSPAAKKSFLQSAEQSWGMAENAILMSNAQAVASREAPLVDLGQVATAAIGGVATQVGINSIGGSDLGQVMTSSAMRGIVGGVGGQPSQVYVPQAYGGADIGAVATASVTNAAGASVSTGVGNLVGGLFGRGKDSAPAVGAPFKEAKAVDPRDFFGHHPRETNAKDLYRNAGHYGWKRVETTTTAHAFSPITGKGVARAAIFNADPHSGAVIAAFRVLAVQPVQFGSVVVAMNEHMGQPARFASADSIMRAVWEDGSFVINDGARVTVGWSASVPAIYVKAPPAPAPAPVPAAASQATSAPVEQYAN
jgi:hypothetical protein